MRINKKCSLSKLTPETPWMEEKGGQTEKGIQLENETITRREEKRTKKSTQ